MKKLTYTLATALLVMTFVACDNKTNENTTDTTANTTEATAETVGNPADVKTDDGPFQIENLKYGYADLEKSFDAKTMEIHFSKHYLGYANNLNKEVAGKDLASKSIEEILTSLDMNNAALRNNGGGYYNHKLFFASLSPNGGGQPTGEIAEAINQQFGSFDELKNQLSEAGAKRFGSGWAWLFVNKDGKLQVGSTANQDNPLMPGLEISGKPVLGIDVWEHAYYLRYQNKRADYITAFFDVVDWNVINENYKQAIQ